MPRPHRIPSERQEPLLSSVTEHPGGTREAARLVIKLVNMSDSPDSSPVVGKWQALSPPTSIPLLVQKQEALNPLSLSNVAAEALLNCRPLTALSLLKLG